MNHVGAHRYNRHLRLVSALLVLLNVAVLAAVLAASTADAFLEQHPAGRLPSPLAAVTRRRRPPPHLHHKQRGTDNNIDNNVLMGSNKRVTIDGLAGWVTSGGSALSLSSSSDTDETGSEDVDDEKSEEEAEEEPDGTTSSIGTDDDENEQHQQQQQQEDDSDETATETKAPKSSKSDNLIRDLHSAPYPFRIVVIGNGAILETTSRLGPYMGESSSPRSGERLVTLASDDRDFEFHLMVDTIGKVTLTESKKGSKEGGKKQKTLRIVRMIREDDSQNGGGGGGGGGGWSPICSLILAESSEESAQWFRDITIRYGYEVYAGD